MKAIEDAKKLSSLVLNAVIMILLLYLVFHVVIRKDPGIDKYNKLIEISKAESDKIGKEVQRLLDKLTVLNSKIDAQQVVINKLQKKDSAVTVNLKSYVEMMSALSEKLAKLKDSQGDPVKKVDFNDDVMSLRARLGTDFRVAYPNITLSAGQLRYENAFALKAVKYKPMYEEALKLSNIRADIIKEYRDNLIPSYKDSLSKAGLVIDNQKQIINGKDKTLKLYGKKYSALKRKRRRDVFIAGLVAVAIGIIIGK